CADIYVLSLHDALPISATRPSSGNSQNPAITSRPSECAPDPLDIVPACGQQRSPSYCLRCSHWARRPPPRARSRVPTTSWRAARSEEHTSELQSRENLV